MIWTERKTKRQNERKTREKKKKPTNSPKYRINTVKVEKWRTELWLIHWTIFPKGRNFALPLHFIRTVGIKKIPVHSNTEKACKANKTLTIHIQTHTYCVCRIFIYFYLFYFLSLWRWKVTFFIFVKGRKSFITSSLSANKKDTQVRTWT